MTTTARVLGRVVMDDGTEETQRMSVAVDIANVVGENGKRETVSLPVGFTALSPPTGAQGVMIELIPPASGSADVTLKGVTGDTGIAVQADASSAADIPPIVLPLNISGASIGITVTDNAMTADVLWF